MEEEVEGTTDDDFDKEKITCAVRARVDHFKEQADFLTFEGVRRVLEKDLGLEAFALDVHKTFIEQILQELSILMEQSSSDSHHDDADVWDLNLDMIANEEVVQPRVVVDEELEKNPNDVQNLVPKVGMEFHSHDQIYDFYNQYARKMGFSIRKGHVKRFKTGEIRKRVLLCSKEGFREQHNRGIPEKARPTTRTGCLARIQCIKQSGLWVVTKFVAEHNHKLASASKAHLLRSQRNLPRQQAVYMDSMRSEGCGLSQAFITSNAEHGGPEHLNFTQKDCDDYFQKRCREIYKEGDVQVALNYFRRMQRENPAFSYAVQVDQNNQACNLFWADAKSKIDYGFFGDVVRFDTTFRIYKYGMPCAPFVGVNHHGTSVLFGCALLVDESTESFAWVFESFLDAMSGKHPKTIITDQTQAIVIALEQVMPNTHRRLCLWHIFQTAAKHLSHVYADNKQFKKDFCNCIYNTETEEDFEAAWESMITKYSVSHNEWLRDLYVLRQKWAPVYGQDNFCAGMTITQRSETVNSFFKGYLIGTLFINDFITQYEKAVLNWREKENQAEYSSKQTGPIFISSLPFEKQAAKVFTQNVFKIFQDRLKNFSCYLDHLEDENDSICIHKVEMVIHIKGDRDRRVCFNTKENAVECSCRSFQFTGILCVHALRVLLSRRIVEIPSQYILKRWTKQAKDGLVVDDIGTQLQVNCHKSSSLRYCDLAHRALSLAMKGSINEGSSRVVKRYLAACLEELNAYQEKARPQTTEAEEQVDGPIILQDSPTKKKKGEQKKRCKNVSERFSNKKNGQKLAKRDKQNELPSTSSNRGGFTPPDISLIANQGVFRLQDQLMIQYSALNPHTNQASFAYQGQAAVMRDGGIIFHPTQGNFEPTQQCSARDLRG